MEEQIKTHLKEREYVKLEKNSKGYNWEIKILGNLNEMFVNEADLARLKILDMKMKEEYGNEVN